MFIVSDFLLFFISYALPSSSGNFRKYLDTFRENFIVNFLDNTIMCVCITERYFHHLLFLYTLGIRTPYLTCSQRQPKIEVTITYLGSVNHKTFRTLRLFPWQPWIECVMYIWIFSDRPFRNLPKQLMTWYIPSIILGTFQPTYISRTR